MRDRYKCDECGFKTTSDYVLKRHTQVSHESKNKDNKSKRKICNECGKRFNKESTYRTHVRTVHRGETNNGGTNNLVENSKSNWYKKITRYKSEWNDKRRISASISIYWQETSESETCLDNCCRDLH